MNTPIDWKTPRTSEQAEWITPTICTFHDDGSVDYEGNTRVIEHVLSAGVDGIVLLGSNGEFFHLTAEEKRKLIDLAVSTIDGQAKLYVGTGAMSQAEAIDLTNYALASGADAALVLGPYYFKMADDQIEGYFDAVASAAEGPIMLYNFPAYTGNDVTPFITQSLLERHDNIVGYKDSVPDVAHTRRVIDAATPVAPGFSVYSGFDENFAHNILAGGAGSIGALSNVIPEICATWVAAARTGSMERLEELQHAIDSLMPIYDIATPFMPAIRYAMNLRGLEISEACRAPFVPLDDEQRHAVRRVLEEAHLI